MEGGPLPDYLDGRFFQVTLLTDERFADSAQLLGGLSAEELAENREYLRILPPGAELWIRRGSGSRAHSAGSPT